MVTPSEGWDQAKMERLSSIANKYYETRNIMKEDSELHDVPGAVKDAIDSVMYDMEDVSKLGPTFVDTHYDLVQAVLDPELSRDKRELAQRYVLGRVWMRLDELRQTYNSGQELFVTEAVKGLLDRAGLGDKVQVPTLEQIVDRREALGISEQGIRA